MEPEPLEADARRSGEIAFTESGESEEQNGASRTAEPSSAKRLPPPGPLAPRRRRTRFPRVRLGSSADRARAMLALAGRHRRSLIVAMLGLAAGGLIAFSLGGESSSPPADQPLGSGQEVPLQVPQAPAARGPGGKAKAPQLGPSRSPRGSRESPRRSER